MDNELKSNEEKDPTFSEMSALPKWIVIMWVGGIAWVIYYIVAGLQSTPKTW